MKRFEWVQASTTDDALGQSTRTCAELMDSNKKTSGASVVKAGGIDLLDLLKEGILSTQRVVNIRSIDDLHHISFDKKGCVIGPLLTLAEIAEHADIRKKFTALADAAEHIATPNIRNAATVGGNLLQRPRCWYFRSEEFNCLKKGGKDCPANVGENKYHAIFDNEKCSIVHPSTAAVALVALGASIELTSRKGKREVKLEEFFISPSEDVVKENRLAEGELITAITIPDNGWKSAHIKLGEKDSFDWSIGDCAVALDMEGSTCKKAVIVLGAAAPVPYRATAAENFLKGKSIDEKTAREAGKLAVQNAKPLSQNEYKVTMLEVAAMRALLKAAQS
ncbi:MAG: FAD binding domain-containing protein [Candidatus Melainabacteria bacterium]|nr:FAD binding domain-containing protein [Candidatus Melainabacteria bacterium]